jgi:hypothetical protein
MIVVCGPQNAATKMITKTSTYQKNTIAKRNFFEVESGSVYLEIHTPGGPRGIGPSEDGAAGNSQPGGQTPPGG